MVDTSTNQVISGSKEFEYLTGSNVLVTDSLSVTGSLTVSGTMAASQIISHLDDSDTKIQFGDNTNQITFHATSDQIVGIYGDNYSTDLNYN